MWVLKLQTSYEGTRVAALAREYKLSLSGYPLRLFKEGNKYFLQATGFIQGDKKNIEALKKEKAFRNMYINGEFLITEIELRGIIPQLYSPIGLYLSQHRLCILKRIRRHSYLGKDLYRLFAFG